MNEIVKCPGCGALVKHLPQSGEPYRYIGTIPGCWEIYGQILAKEYGEYSYPEDVHRLTVDTYAVQHPGKPGRQSIQSVNGHLASLHLVLEQHFTGKRATAALGAILKHADRFVWLEPPEPNGRMTVIDVVKAASLQEHKELVERWANDVWASWARHHDTIRQLVRDLRNPR